MYLPFLLPKSLLTRPYIPLRSTIASVSRRRLNSAVDGSSLFDDDGKEPQPFTEAIPLSPSSKPPVDLHSKTQQQRGVIKPAVEHSWIAHRERMKTKFPDGWNPQRKLSREAMDGIRMMHSHDPVKHSTEQLAKHFNISSEAVRRILKSRWRPSVERMLEMEEKEKNMVEMRKREMMERKERQRKLRDRLGGKWPKVEGSVVKNDRLMLQ